MTQQEPPEYGQRPPPVVPQYGPQYGQQPYAPPPTGDYPGRTLGIVGLVLSFFTTLIGFIVSIIAFRQSRKAGYKNTPALIGIIIGAVATVIGIVVLIVLLTVGVNAARHVAHVCSQLGPGVHVVNGVTYRCG